MTSATSHQHIGLRIPDDGRATRVRRPDRDDWELFYDEVVGFEPQPGIEYELVVEVTTVDDPPADGSSLRYALVAELSAVPLGPEPD